MMAVNNQRVEEQSPFGKLTVIGEDKGSGGSEAPYGNLTVVGDDVDGGFTTRPLLEAQGSVVSEEQRMSELDEAIAREDSLTAPGGSQDVLHGRLVEKLRDREGVKQEAYLDSLEKPTGGVGHLLTGKELEEFPIGSKIPQDRVDKWLEEDSKEALESARRQAEEIGNVSEELVIALASVNFQLGTSWNKIHEDTWRLLKEGRYKEAADEAANSEWADQTPRRVKDFQEALYKEAEK